MYYSVQKLVTLALFKKGGWQKERGEGGIYILNFNPGMD